MHDDLGMVTDHLQGYQDCVILDAADQGHGLDG